MVATFLASLAFGFGPHASTVLDLEPTDNVWVYAHAPDPASDKYLRVWGANGTSVATVSGDAEDYSYSYLKWDLSTLPKEGRLVAATLILTHIANPGFPLDYARSNPLEARALSADFTEKTWSFSDVARVSPQAGKEGLYGSVAPDGLPGEATEIKLNLDLSKSEAFRKAVGERKPMALALTSSMEPQAMGGKSLYKIYSRYAPKDKHPVLHLVFES